MVLSCLRNGATLVDNLVDGIITLQVLEGAVEFTVDTGTVTLQKQQIITVHAGIKYNVKAVENTLLLMTGKVENKTQNIAA